MRAAAIVAVIAACLTGCIELDFFLFDPEKADSVAGDYHGLPLWNGSGAPQWILDAEVEREIYIRVPSAEVIPPGALAGQQSYIHGAFLHAPTTCPLDQCPLIDNPPTIIYQHGNSGHMWRYWYRAVALWNMGANVFIYTYRGYGLSPGEPTNKRVLEDAATAMQYVSTRPDVNPLRIVAYGYSMGGVPTSHLVGRSEHKHKFAACILEAALDSPESLVDTATGTDFGGGFFLDEDSPFDGPDFIKGSNLPILHMHGANDSILLLSQSESYYQVLKNRPSYTHYLGKTQKPDEAWIKGCDHRNIPVWSWDGTEHIPHYWGHKKNPTHCCVHPLEYPDQAHAGFLDAIGHTTGDQLLTTSLDYKRLIADWLKSVLP
jgi:fermentation-respiration switch protein FrsA (DUF1100 family)